MQSSAAQPLDQVKAFSRPAEAALARADGRTPVRRAGEAADRILDDVSEGGATRSARVSSARLRYLHGGRRALALGLGVLALAPALVLATPLIVALAVRHGGLDRVLFRQPRIGRDGRVFRIWKFRTMADVPTDPHEAFERWSRGEGEVTRLGRWLRETHLDELPQLVNVLAGDMDLVGPRPEMVEVHRWATRAVPGFHRRNAARPGLTGLAQLEHGYAGKDVEAYRAKLDADLRYLARPSLAGDLVLLVRTARALLGRGRTRR